MRNREPHPWVLCSTCLLASGHSVGADAVAQTVKGYVLLCIPLPFHPAGVWVQTAGPDAWGLCPCGWAVLPVSVQTWHNSKAGGPHGY